MSLREVLRPGPGNRIGVREYSKIRKKYAFRGAFLDATTGQWVEFCFSNFASRGDDAVVPGCLEAINAAVYLDGYGPGDEPYAVTISWFCLGPATPWVLW